MRESIEKKMFEFVKWFTSTVHVHLKKFIIYSSSPAGSAAAAGSAFAAALAALPGLLNFVSNCLRFRSWGWSLSW